MLTRSILLTLAIVFLARASARSQTSPDTLTPQATPDQFPVGVLITGNPENTKSRLDSLQNMLGINSYFELQSEGDAGQFAREGKPFDTMAAIRDPFYWNSSVNTDYRHYFQLPFHPVSFDSSIVNLLTEAITTPEVRVFLPGTAGWTKQYDYSWNLAMGGPANHYDSVILGGGNSNEWFIPGDVVTLAGGYVLKLSDGTNINAAGKDPYANVSGETDFHLDTNHIGAYTYDFVFRMDTVAIPLGNLFRLDISVGDTQMLSSIVINSALYSALPFANETINGRRVRGDSLATWKSPTGPDQNRPYKLLRITIPASVTRALWGAPANPPPPINVRLWSYGTWSIYPRLIRIRNWIAEQVLEGKCDSLLVAAGKILANVYPHNSADKSWKFTREMDWRAYRCLAYVHNLFCDNGLPPLNLLQGGPMDLLARIWRDQCEANNVAKGQLWYEAALFGGVGWRQHDDISAQNPQLNIGTYGMDSSSFYHNWAPVPSAIMPNAYNAFRHGIRVVSSHSAFTTDYQDSIIGYASENPGGGSGWEEGMKEFASSCYGDPTGPAIPMRMSPQLLGGHFEMPKWSMDSLQMILRWAIENSDTSLFRGVLISQLGVGDTIDINDWTSSAFAIPNIHTNPKDWWSHDMENELTASLIFNPFRSRHPRDTVVVLDSLLDWFWLGGRMPTTTEASFQLWWGITHGLKGYLLNYGGDDGLTQHGIVQLDLTKTQNVVGIPDIYRRYSGVGLDTRVAQFYVPNADVQPFTTFEGFHQYIYVDSSGNSHIIKLLPPPNNYAGLFNEVQREMRDDLGPLENTLAALNWLGSVCWNKKDSTPTYLSRLPVQGVSTKNLSGASDATSYVDFGIHELPSDSLARYLSVLNRLLWTDSTGTDQTDTRNITMHVRDSAFNPLYYGWPTWEVTNKGTGWDTVIHLDSNFSITLEAGRGALLRIAPYTSITTGHLTTNEYNNARHIAYDEAKTDSTHLFWFTYERKGDIILSSPLERSEGASQRTVGTPPDSLIDSSGKAHNPAVAFNAFGSQGLGLVYSIDHAGKLGDSTFIIFRHSNRFTPYKFSAKDTLEKFLTDATFPATPAITPIRWQASGRPALTYWVSWHNPVHGGAITALDTSGNTLPIAYFSGGGHDSATTSFISIASLIDTLTKPVCHVAFQMDTNAATHIYYCQAHIDTPGTPTIVGIDSTLRISKGLTFCESRMPSIAKSSTSISVVWESYFYLIGGFKNFFTHYAIHRVASSANAWSDFVAYNAYHNWGSTDSIILLPNNVWPGAINWTALAGVPVSTDFYRIGWNNNADDHMRIARTYLKIMYIYIPWIGMYFALPWPYSVVEKISESSLEPALPVRDQGSQLLLDPIAFRSSVQHSDGTFDAKVTQFPLPLVPEIPDSVVTQTIAATASGGLCPWPGIELRGGTTTDFPLTTGGNPTRAGWYPVDTGYQSGNHVAVTWDNPQVRTQSFAASAGDSLSYARVFHVGTEQPGDTSNAEVNLTSSRDYVRGSMELRKASDNSIVLVLDTACLTTTGFKTSTIDADSGYGHVAIPFTDTFYLTMEMSRGDSTDGYELSHIESYDDPIQDILPIIDTNSSSFKRALPNPGASGSQEQELDVTVHPNPVQGMVKICVSDLAQGIPAVVDVVNYLGERVAKLYDATPDAELGLCLQLDCSHLPSGIYYADLQANGSHKAVQFSVQH